MTPGAPTLTIGMPVFNGARFIRAALDSLLAQTFTDFELLISDNASTDETAAICRDYAMRDPRIRYVRQERNLGLFPNTEFVMRAARGRYFMLVGDDDVYRPEYAHRLVAELERYPAAGLCYSNFGYVREDGTFVPAGTTVFVQASWSRFRNLTAHLLKRPVLPMIMGVFRTEVARSALPFVSFGPMLGGVDLVFMARALARARAHSVRDVLFHYRLKNRASSFPSDWPTTWVAQRWYLFKVNARVTWETCRAIHDSDLPAVSRSALYVFAFATLVAHLAVYPAVAATRERTRAARAAVIRA